MKKRRTDASGLEDVERTLHTSFCAAANSISQLYTQAQQQHKIAFQAGQRHGLEKLCEWIQKQHQCGVMPSTADVLNYLKNEVDNLGQNEINISQAQNQALPSQYHQLAPPNPFSRSGSTTDQQRFPLAFPQDFLSG